MTKYQAFEAIAAVSDDVSWIEYRDRILAILDQIDQPPVEFTVKELMDLLMPGDYVHLYVKQGWYFGGRIHCQGQGIDALRAKLLELAKPPMPAILCIELPTSTVMAIAAGRECEVQAACKAALEKAKL